MRTRSIPTLVAALSLCAAATLVAREFEDTFGRIINAELVSHTGSDAEEVKILKPDGKEFDVKISAFSKKDQEFIRAWMKATPATVNYAFRIEATKKKIGGQGYSNYGVEVTNLTRQTVEGITVKTRSLYESSYHSYGSAYFRYGPLIMAYEEKFDIPTEMKFNQTAKFPTRQVYNLLGIMIQVYNAEDKMIAEQKLGSTKLASLAWDDGRKRSTTSSSGTDSGGTGKSTVIIED